MNASTAGKQFHTTGGNVINSDDYFISQERRIRLIKMKKMEGDKAARNAWKQKEQKALVLVRVLREQQRSFNVSVDDPNQLTNTQLKILLDWKMNTLPIPKRKPERAAAWLEWRTKEAHEALPEWSEQEENELVRLQTEEVTIRDTELGRIQQEELDRIEATIAGFPAALRQQLKDKLDGGTPDIHD